MKDRNRSPFQAMQGFTLLEILLAVALLSVILAAVYSTFNLSHKAMEGMDESLLGLQESRSIVDTLTREIESLSYGQSTRLGVFKVEDRDLYGKQASRFTFTTFSPLVPGLSQVSYYVEEREGRPVLYKKIKPAYKKEDVAAAELMEGIDSFSVEVKDGDKWVKTWEVSGATRVPAEIRITLTVTLKGRPITLYETLRPRIGNAA